jgi:uncharacterized protein YegP (UPF0339 family)
VNRVTVELIEVKPLTYEQWADRYRGFTNPHSRYRDYRDKFQPWRWIAKGANNRTLARSSERYFNEADCRHAIGLLFGPGSTVVLRAGGVETVLR